MHMNMRMRVRMSRDKYSRHRHWRLRHSFVERKRKQQADEDLRCVSQRPCVEFRIHMIPIMEHTLKTVSESVILRPSVGRRISRDLSDSNALKRLLGQAP